MIFINNISPDILAEFYREKQERELKARRRKKHICGASLGLAAVIAAVVGIAVWQGAFPKNSAVVEIPNVSVDHSADTSRDESVPAPVTDEDLWKAMYLNAVYNVYRDDTEEDAFSEAYPGQFSNGLEYVFQKETESVENTRDDQTVYCVILEFAHKEHHKRTAYLLRYHELKDSNPIIAEYEGVLNGTSDSKTPLSDLKVAYNAALKEIQAQAEKAADAVNEAEGWKIIMDAVENTANINVFHRKMKLVYSYENGYDGTVNKEYYLCFVTQSDVEALEKLVNENPDFGIALEIAPEYLKTESDTAYIN